MRTHNRKYRQVPSSHAETRHISSAFRFLLLLASLLLASMLMLQLFASNVYASSNDDTGYRSVLEDDIDLFTESEEADLIDQLNELTAYGNAAVKTIGWNYYSTSSYAEQYYHETFGYEDGTLFLIDLDNRMLYIYSYGNIYKVITKARANTITDNIYKYASDGDYYACSQEALSEMLTLLQGNEIAQPMKYISNALLAILLALLIHFIIIHRIATLHSTSRRKLMQAAKTDFSFSKPDVIFLNETKTFSPVERSSGGGGGSHGGGGGGGGFSGGGGGGGGHRF